MKETITQQNEKKNYDFCQKTITKMNEIEQDYIARAKDLHRIRQLNLYHPSWDSFEEFCMELKGLKYKSVMKLIAIYEKFVLEYKISPARIAQAGGWSTVAEVLPMVKEKHDANKWLNIAENSTREHLRQDIKEAKSGIDMDMCKHEDMYVFCSCGVCGWKERVYLSPKDIDRVLRASDLVKVDRNAFKNAKYEVKVKATS